MEEPAAEAVVDDLGLSPARRSQLHCATDRLYVGRLLARPPGQPRQAVEVTAGEGNGIQLGDHLGMCHHDALGWVPVHLIRVKDAPEVFRKHLEQGAPAPPELLAAGSKDPATAKAPPSAEADTLDARVLEVDYNAGGERYKEWKQLILDYQFTDWPVEGPLSTGHLLRHFGKFGGDRERWLSEWIRARQVSETDRVAFEMRTLTDCLYTAGTYDQVNVPSLACMGIVSRRVQGLVDAYAAGPPGNPDMVHRSCHHRLQESRGCHLAGSPNVVRDHRRGLQVPPVLVADGMLPKAWKGARPRASCDGQIPGPPAICASCFLNGQP